MKRLKVATYSPQEKLPKASTPLEQHVVLIFCDRWGEGKSWHRGVYLGSLKEWRVSGDNSAVEVEFWMEMPKP